ncbi:MAG: CpsD/CapB family tyrosine-protein kinase [Anaerolineae bacterium]|nr:CpsD/CapB family tyrosine-protein kinase [Anaerolineae bacterium]
MATVGLIMLAEPQSAAAEAYRALRTNLLFSTVDRPANTLVITGPTPEVGKSTVAANLAITLAQGGHETILVDCDLRQPRQHELWGVDNQRGLTTMMLDPAALAQPPLQSVNVEHLSILPGGPLPPNPADLLGSRRMDEVIGVLKARAEFVLFDAPPVLAVADAAILGSKVDGVLLVVRAGQTRRDQAIRAKELLDQVHIRIVGSVLTNAPRDAAVAGYYA